VGPLLRAGNLELAVATAEAQCSGKLLRLRLFRTTVRPFLAYPAGAHQQANLSDVACRRVALTPVLGTEKVVVRHIVAGKPASFETCLRRGKVAIVMGAASGIGARDRGHGSGVHGWLAVLTLCIANDRRRRSPAQQIGTGATMRHTMVEGNGRPRTGPPAAFIVDGWCGAATWQKGISRPASFRCARGQ
jgi:hypothetical protein